MTTAQQQAYDAAIYQQVTSMGIPDVVAKNIVAQARHESGDYTSNVFNHTNNAFGYTYFPLSNWQTGDGYEGFAVYSNIQHSAGEVADWLKRREKDGKFSIASLTTPEAYATALHSNGYFTDAVENYINGMKAAFSRINWQTVAVVGGGSAAVLLLVVAFFLLITKK